MVWHHDKLDFVEESTSIKIVRERCRDQHQQLLRMLLDTRLWLNWNKRLVKGEKDRQMHEPNVFFVVKELEIMM